ncbi:MAG: hypothetical protein ABS934_03350 [Psychrobacillus sp.]
MKYGWNLSTNKSYFHLLVVVQDGYFIGMSETDKTSQPCALAMGDGISLTPRKASGWRGNQFYLLLKNLFDHKSTLPFNMAFLKIEK